MLGEIRAIFMLKNKDISEKQKELLELVHGKKDYSKCADEMEELR